MSVSLLLALAANPAHAESEILFRASRPVLIFVDGRQAPLTNNLRMRASNLEPGVHDVEVKGVFGKTLYAGEVQLDDWTLAYAEWADGELAITRTEKLDKRRLRARHSPWADDEDRFEPEPVEEPEAEGVADEEEVEPAVEEEPELAVPVEEPEPILPVEEPEPAEILEPEEPVTPGAVLVDKSEEPAAATDPESAPAVTIQAREGVTFELQHGEATLQVTVRDGAFVVDFPVGE